MSSFKTWWETEGSSMRPNPNEDIEEFAKRVTQIAWSNGEYVEREACAKVADEQAESPALAPLEKYRAGFIADVIRARGQK